jgi:hypothetical protein
MSPDTRVEDRVERLERLLAEAVEDAFGLRSEFLGCTDDPADPVRTTTWRQLEADRFLWLEEAARETRVRRRENVDHVRGGYYTPSQEEIESLADKIGDED